MTSIPFFRFSLIAFAFPLFLFPKECFSMDGQKMMSQMAEDMKNEMRGNDTQMMAKMGEGEAMNHGNETAMQCQWKDEDSQRKWREQKTNRRMKSYD
ncbi:hypothetical protein niasHT_012804 [Heterodera trifolii]|uniref:Uncharacterized protein n=1 Tax=Heterodera trifolii TaxID=157864 RepID=A0ABD2L980_9BILA